MNKYKWLYLSLVFVVIVLGCYALVFSTLSVRNTPQLSENAPKDCANNVYGMMSSYSMMGGRNSTWGYGNMMSGSFPDQKVTINNDYYSYMGTWNMFQIHRFMWRSWMNGSNIRYMMSGPNQYSLYIQCGWENRFFPQR